MCRCRMHRDTEHRGWNLHATAALVQAVRSQKNNLPGPPKGAPSLSWCSTAAFSTACLSCICANKGPMCSIAASGGSVTAANKGWPTASC